MKERHRSDTERAILVALADIPEPKWCSRYLGYGKSLGTRLERAYRTAHPARRNRPQFRHVERGLRVLVEAGEVELKTSARVGNEHERYYRLTPSGWRAAASLKADPLPPEKPTSERRSRT